MACCRTAAAAPNQRLQRHHSVPTFSAPRRTCDAFRCETVEWHRRGDQQYNPCAAGLYGRLSAGQSDAVSQGIAQSSLILEFFHLCGTWDTYNIHIYTYYYYTILHTTHDWHGEANTRWHHHKQSDTNHVVVQMLLCVSWAHNHNADGSSSFVLYIQCYMPFYTFRIEPVL